MKPFKFSLVQFMVIYLSCVMCQKKPHIVMIIPDDMGWNDVGFHGSNQIPTPNIDALAYNGVILDKFYTQHTCTPSRAALMTGNYPIRSGMQGYPMRTGENRFLPLDTPTLPERMKDLGYKTHLVGKWHLGHAYKNVTPIGRGYDTFFGYWNGYVSYVDYRVQFTDNSGVDLHEGYYPADKKFQTAYATDLFTDKSLDIIEQHDTKEPLMLVVSHLAAHTGNEENGNSLTTPDLEETNKRFGYVENARRRNYTDIVYQLDKSVGKVMGKLSEKNMLNDTIVIYFHDNGAQTSGGLHQNYGSNWPLRGQKFSMYEGAVRGTCVVYSPLLEQSGYINDQLMHISDWLPTLYAAGGGNPNDLGTIDGINQWDTISKNKLTTRTELLVNIDDVNNYSAVIGQSGKYKLINGSFLNGIYDQYDGEVGRGPENPQYNAQDILLSPTNLAIKALSTEELTEEKILAKRKLLDLSSCRSDAPYIDCNKRLCLFDLYNDPCETKDLFAQLPAVAEELSEKLQGFYGQLVPQVETIIDARADPKLCGDNYFVWLEEDGCRVSGTEQKNSMQLFLITVVGVFIVVGFV